MDLHRQRSFDVADLSRHPPPPPLVSQLSLQSTGGKSTTSSTSKKKQLALKIILLDDSVTIIQAQAKATGRVVFEQICKQLNILEADYFGLEYLNQESTCGPMYFWLDLEKRLSHQVGLNMTDPALRFSVKFYTPDPSQLEEEFTRYLYSLQIRKDLANGQLMCNDNTASLMASYLVQAECGDFNEEDYPDSSYLRAHMFVPNQDESIEYRIRENHKKHIGQSPGEADLHLLETARRTEFYGVRMYPAKDDEGVQLNLAVCHMGVLVFQNCTKINTFSWGKIRKLSFKRKKFIVKLHPEGFGYYKEVVEFSFGHRNECKAFWKCCVEHHSFFRCDVIQHTNNDQNRRRSKSLLSSRGSSFRYSGRTQKQMVSFVRENFMKRNIGGAAPAPTSSVSSSTQATPNSVFQRSSSFRSAATTTPVQTHQPQIHAHHYPQHSGVSTSCSSPAVIDRDRHQEVIGGSPSTEDSFSPGTSINSSPQQQQIQPTSHPQLYSTDNHQQQGNIEAANQSHRSVSSLLLYSEKEFPVTTYRTPRRQSTDDTRSNASSSNNRRRRKMLGGAAAVIPAVPLKTSKPMIPRYSSDDYDNEEEDVENIIHISRNRRALALGPKSKPKYYSDDEEEYEEEEEDDNEEEREIVRSRVSFRRRSGSYLPTNMASTLPRNNSGSLGDSICSKYKSKEDTTSHGSYDLLDSDSVPYLLRRRIEIEKHDPLMKSKSFGGHCKKSLKRSKVFRFASFNHLLWNYSWRDDTIDWLGTDQEQIFGPPQYWGDQDQADRKGYEESGDSDKDDENEETPVIAVNQADEDESDISSEDGKELDDDFIKEKDTLVLEAVGEEWLPIRRMSMCSNIVRESEEPNKEEENSENENDDTIEEGPRTEGNDEMNLECEEEDDIPKEMIAGYEQEIEISDDEAQMQEQPVGGSLSAEEESLRDEVVEENLQILQEMHEGSEDKCVKCYDEESPPPTPTTIDNAKSRFISQEGPEAFQVQEGLVDEVPEEGEVYYVTDVAVEDIIAEEENEDELDDEAIEAESDDNKIAAIEEEEEEMEAEPVDQIRPPQHYPIFFENTLARTTIFPERSTAQLATLIEEDHSKEEDDDEGPEMGVNQRPSTIQAQTFTFNPTPRSTLRKLSTTSLDDLPLPPPIEEAEEYEYIDCETPKFPPPDTIIGGNGYDSRRSSTSVTSATTSVDAPTVICQASTSSHGSTTGSDNKRKLQLQRTFSVEQPDIVPSSPPVPPPRRSSSGCTETIEECSSDNENSSSPEMPPMFLNFPRTLSRISERTHSSESSFMEKIETRLKEKRALRVASAEEESTATMSLDNQQARAPLVTLTSELGDSSATLNDLEEICEEENGNGGPHHPNVGHGSAENGENRCARERDGSGASSQHSVHRVTLSLNVVEGKIVFDFTYYDKYGWIIKSLKVLQNRDPPDWFYYLMRELIQTQRTFTSDLKLITSPLLHTNEILLQQLESSLGIRKELWEETTHGLYSLSLLVKHFENHCKLWEDYLENGLNFQKYEEKFEGYLPVTALALKPIYRLIYLQKDFLGVLRRNVKQSEGIQLQLKQLSDKLDRVITPLANKVKGMQPELESQSKIIELKRELTGSCDIHPGEFIRQGLMLKLSSKRGLQSRIFFLFTNVLMYGSRISSASGFRLHGLVPLHTCTFSEEQCDPISNSFTIQTGGEEEKLLIVGCSSVQDKTNWLDALRSAQVKSKVYSTKLSAASSNELTNCLPPPPLPVETNNNAVVVNHRANATTHVCWHRNLSFNQSELCRAFEYSLSGYLLRKFKNSPGWQRLFVVYTNLCLFFYKNHEEVQPLASLPLLGYTVAIPSGNENSDNKKHVFKLVFKTHVYYFRAESPFTFKRWMSVLQSSTSLAA